MNIKKAGIVLGSIVGVIYGLFLIVPFLLTGLVNSYNSEISKIVEESTGFKLQLEDLGVVTTPKLTVGVKAGHISIALPSGDEILSTENAQAKLSLIPLLIGRVEADLIKADNVNVSLKVRPDGHFLIEEAIPAPQDTEEEVAAPLTGLPCGLKLSNHLPDIVVKDYNLALVDMRNNKTYGIKGQDLKVNDFILNKKVKVSTLGSVIFDKDIPFNYDIKVLNRIMPDVELNDLVFGSNSAETTSNPTPIAFNIIDILEGVRKNQFSANLKTDIKTFGKPDNININGLIDVENITIAVNGKKLPEGHIKIDFRGKGGISDITLYTAEDEKTELISQYKGGRSKKLDLVLKSNAKINNIFNIIKSSAAAFNYSDLATLSGTGEMSADFRLKSNMKQVQSSGYFRIPEATVKYALYNILIDKINADVDFSNNMVNIKNVGFSILNQPLKLSGTVKPDTTTDVHLKADKLPVKGLIAAAGQLGILKDNDIKSGALSMDASLKGDFKRIQPLVDVSLDSLDVLNKPSSMRIKLPSAKVKLDENNVKISDTYLIFNNSRIDIIGQVSDYLTKKILIDIKAKGALVAGDVLNMLPKEMHSMFGAKGSMPVYVRVSGNDKSQVVDAQLLATPNGYFRAVDINSLSGKNSLVRANIALEGNNLKLTNTGLYTSTKASIDESGSVSGLSQIVNVTGGVNLANLNLNNLKIATIGTQTLGIPGFKNSKADINADILLNGASMNPSLSGKIGVPNVSIPTIKTTLKNIDVNLNSSFIDVNLPAISVDNSTMSAKTSISTNFANGVLVKSVDFKGDYIDADTLGAAFAGMPSDSSGGSSSAPQDIGVVVQNGKGSVAKFKTGSIIATNLTSDFGLKNNVFYLKNLKGDAFSGKINGNINCNVISGKTGVEMTGSGMNAVSAIEGAAGIKNALSGTLGFDTKLTLNAFAPTYNAMLQSISGGVSFDVKDGHYANIGSLDQLLLAQNLATNVVLKTALASIRNLKVVQDASNFSSITGNLTLNKGIATLKSIKSTGPSMAYLVTGDYNLINGYTNVIVLGRLGADVVSALGVLGDLSASKLTSYIPKFGNQTAVLINAMTSNPKAENTAQIPAISGNNSNTKDFKVVFTGLVTNPASIKSFKWLTTCDTSAISGGSIAEQLKTNAQAIKTTGKDTVKDVKNTVKSVKTTTKTTVNDVKEQVQKTKDSVQDLKNLKNMFKKPSGGLSSGNAE